MEHLIDKDAVMAEIEKLYNGEIDTYTRNILDRLKSKIDTLKVIEIGVDLGDPKGDKSAKYIIDTKEVDLERSIDVDSMVTEYLKQYEEAGQTPFAMNIIGSAYRKGLEDMFRLKAQKEEKV